VKVDLCHECLVGWSTNAHVDVPRSPCGASDVMAREHGVKSGHAAGHVSTAVVSMPLQPTSLPVSVVVPVTAPRVCLPNIDGGRRPFEPSAVFRGTHFNL
jgi:hypothetical protein